jgi:hypothetical protein
VQEKKVHIGKKSRLIFTISSKESGSINVIDISKLLHAIKEKYNSMKTVNEESGMLK